MTPVYQIEGTETEAGVAATIPIEASTGDEAVRKAGAQGLKQARVVGVRESGTPVPSRHSGVMPAEELVEKTSVTVRGRTLQGWLLLLFAIPAALLVCSALGSLFEWPWLLVSLIEIVAVLIIVALAIRSFRPYWT